MKRKSENKRRSSKGDLWQEALSYLKETRNYIYFAVVLFFVSALVGFLFPENFSFFEQFLRELAERVEGLSLLGLILFIFQNNVTGAFFAMILGVFLGVFPVFNALLNGAILGYVFNKAAAVGGFSVIWLLLPHGIFELPAIFIALGLGIRFGMFVLAPSGKKGGEFKKRFWGSLKVFLAIVLPLLIIAAIIEGLLIFSQG